MDPFYNDFAPNPLKISREVTVSPDKLPGLAQVLQALKGDGAN